MQSINLTVKQLNMYVRSLLEGDSNLACITLVAELSGFKSHFSSGHWYFTLRDSDASVKSVMFKGNASYVDFKPEDGMKVACRGYVSLYERDGQFQFYAETMQQFGEGFLNLEFERIKKKLDSEGLFDPSKKRRLPPFPKKIGVVTAKSGAAFQDILQVTNRRYPASEIVLFPSLVQGDSAPKELISALKKAYSRDDLDLIIIGRGGGSAEDLACFNNEELARFVAQSPIPIISAVGHEIDFSICDFAADLRAPTPSAAAELAVPSSEELLDRINFFFDKINTSCKKRLNENQIWLDNIMSKSFFVNPKTLFEPFDFKLNVTVNRLINAYNFNIKNCENKFNRIAASLEALSPEAVMKRGFSVVYNKNSNVILNSADINCDDELIIRFLNGSADVKVLNINLE